METDAAEKSAIVVIVWIMISVDARLGNTVPAVLFLQLLMMLEIDSLIIKMVGTGLKENIGLLRLCVGIKPRVLLLLERVIKCLLWWRGLTKERV
jgi:hypothetical protein